MKTTSNQSNKPPIGMLALMLAAPLVCNGQAVPSGVADAKLEQTWTLDGLPTENDEHLNISGIAMSADLNLLVLGADEESAVQILRRHGEGEYAQVEGGNYALDPGQETELDIEGIARSGHDYWVVGSHSLKRKTIRDRRELEQRLDDGKNLKNNYNHERIATTVPEPTREWVYVVKIDDEGAVKADSVVRGSLRTILTNHPLLAPFRTIPSKENGIDIEGLALIPDEDDKKKAKLYVGLRGPVLRGPRAVVLVLDAERKRSKLKLKLDDTKYLALDGRGVRGISRLDDGGDGFLVLAGPIGDAPVPYLVYQWNGKDTIPEADKLHAADNVQPLCRISPPEETPGAKAEGIQVLGRDGDQVRFVIVYDSVENGSASEFTCKLRQT